MTLNLDTSKYIFYQIPKHGDERRLYVSKQSSFADMISKRDYQRAVNGIGESEIVDGKQYTIYVGTTLREIQVRIRERSKLNCNEKAVVLAQDLYRQCFGS